MSDNRPQQPLYGAVALSVTCFAVYLITILITFVARAQHRSPLALAGTLALAFAVLAAIALGLVHELQRRRSATWINLGWSALALIVSTTGVMVQAFQQHIPRRALTAIIVGTACTSGLPFAL